MAELTDREDLMPEETESVSASFPEGEEGFDEGMDEFSAAPEAYDEDAAEYGEPSEEAGEERVSRSRVEVVTEAVVHEKKLPHSSERSATIETVSSVVGDGVTDSEFLAGVKPVIHYHLSDYDGPLDLLLELITASKIAIEDIFISDVTRQYVEIISSIPREELDYEYAGEFITIAAQLVYLKSLRTLPPDEDEDSDFYIDPEVERREFIRKIQAFALMKEQSQKLRERETINRFYRLPTYTEKDYRVVLTNFSLPKLVEAFARVMVNADRRQASVIPKKVMKERVSVAEQMNNILDLASRLKQFSFLSLLEPDFDKSDIITTFLAVLELLKYGRLHVEQEETFGNIMIYAVEGADYTPIDFKEDKDGEY